MDKKRFIKAALLFISAIVILIWGFNYLKNNDLLKTDSEYYAVYNHINDLSTGNAIYINGYKIGNISDISFKDGNLDRLIVKFFISKDIKLPKDAIAEIVSLDLMGTKGIKLLVKNGTTDEFLQPGDTLLSAVEGDLKEQVNKQILPLKLKAEDLIGSIDSVMVVINTILNDKTRENLNKSFSHIQVTLKNLESTTFALDTLMYSQKTKLAMIIANAESITTNLAENNDNIGNILQNFSDISDTLAQANFAHVINQADLALTQFNSVMTQINSGEGTVGKLIYDEVLFENLLNASKNLDLLMIDIKQNPKRYIRFSAIDLGRTVIKQEVKKDTTKTKDDK